MRTDLMDGLLYHLYGDFSFPCKFTPLALHLYAI